MGKCALFLSTSAAMGRRQQSELGSANKLCLRTLWHPTNRNVDRNFTHTISYFMRSPMKINGIEWETAIEMHKFYSPTTSRSLVAIPVWNDGASADTSQLYFPVTIGCTIDNVTWLSFDMDRCNGMYHKNNEKLIHNHFTKIHPDQKVLAFQKVDV